ncbi:MAG: FimV/HubP family polar landmark protein, partial [Methylophilaceae bacterium]
AGPVESADEEITLSGTESSDVDTKLDLVTAYMDMGDTEGARELLEEVLQEGGPQQRERAKKMLDSLA